MQHNKPVSVEVLPLVVAEVVAIARLRRHRLLLRLLLRLRRQLDPIVEMHKCEFELQRRRYMRETQLVDRFVGFSV